MALKVESLPGDVVVVSWTEPVALDAASVPALKDDFQAVSGPRIVFDMAQVTFIDSAIIGFLVGQMRAARAAGGDAKLARLTEEVNTIFELTRLHQVFDIHDGVEAAVAAFSSP